MAARRAAFSTVSGIRRPFRAQYALFETLSSKVRVVSSRWAELRRVGALRAVLTLSADSSEVVQLILGSICVRSTIAEVASRARVTAVDSRDRVCTSWTLLALVCKTRNRLFHHVITVSAENLPFSSCLTNVFQITRDRVARSSGAVEIDWTVLFLVSGVSVAIIPTSARLHGRCVERTAVAIFTLNWCAGAFRAVEAQCAAFARLFLTRTKVVDVSAWRARVGLDRFRRTVMAGRAFLASHVDKSRNVAIVACLAVLTVEGVDLLCPGIISTDWALVQLTLVDQIISLRWTVMARRTFGGIALTELTQVARLAGHTVSDLHGAGGRALRFEGTPNRNKGSHRAVLACFTLSSGRVWLRVVIILFTDIACGALFCDDTSTAVVARNALLTILLSSVVESTRWADRLSLFTASTAGLGDTFVRNCGIG